MDAVVNLFEPLPAQRLGDQVYAHLIEAIATNRLTQGAKIQEDSLAAQMGVSKTPVREALRRLEVEGFITVDPRRTPEVRRLDTQDIHDLYTVRESLERLAARLMAQRRDSGVLASLESVQAAAEARMARRSRVAISESVEYNRQFHRLIFEGTGNRRLQRMYQLLDVDVRRLSHQSVGISGRQRDAVIQHRAILDAVAAGNADRAEGLMMQHIQQAREDLIRILGAMEKSDTPQ